MLADQERVEAGRPQALELLARAQPGLADSNTIVRDGVPDLERSFRMDVQRAQVTIVDAQNTRARFRGARCFLASVDFDERLHAQVATEREQGTQLLILQNRYDQQKGVRIGGARLPNLP